MSTIHKITFLVRCPYCKHLFEQEFPINGNYSISKVVYCELESGGCDNPFAYRAKLTASPEEYAFAGVTVNKGANNE